MDISIIVVIVIVLLVIALIAVISSSGTKSQPQWKSILKSNVYKAETNSRSNNYAEVKDSLVELDKLLDYLLQSRRVSGNTLGERLKNSKNMFSKSDYNTLWSAHKLRNSLVHEVGNNININIIKSNSNAMAAIIKKNI